MKPAGAQPPAASPRPGGGPITRLRALHASAWPGGPLGDRTPSLASSSASSRAASPDVSMASDFEAAWAARGRGLERGRAPQHVVSSAALEAPRPLALASAAWRLEALCTVPPEAPALHAPSAVPLPYAHLERQPSWASSDPWDDESLVSSRAASSHGRAPPEVRRTLGVAPAARDLPVRTPSMFSLASMASTASDASDASDVSALSNASGAPWRTDLLGAPDTYSRLSHAALGSAAALFNAAKLEGRIAQIAEAFAHLGDDVDEDALLELWRLALARRLPADDALSAFRARMQNGAASHVAPSDEDLDDDEAWAAIAPAMGAAPGSRLHRRGPRPDMLVWRLPDEAALGPEGAGAPLDVPSAQQMGRADAGLTLPGLPSYDQLPVASVAPAELVPLWRGPREVDAYALPVVLHVGGQWRLCGYPHLVAVLGEYWVPGLEAHLGARDPRVLRIDDVRRLATAP